MKDMRADREREDGGNGHGDGGWAMETETNGRPMNEGWKKSQTHD